MTDFFVDVVLSVDGLLTLIKSVYGILRKYQGLEESYRNPHWRLHFQGNVLTLMDPEIHSFAFLQYALQNGQAGWFEGSNSSFRFKVFNTHIDEICPSLIGKYPRVEVAIKTREQRESCLTPELCDDWISPKMKANACYLRSSYAYDEANGENFCESHESDSQICDSNSFSKWTSSEKHILSLLLQTGNSFEDCWTSILQYTFIAKSKKDTAEQWQQLRSLLPGEVSENEEDIVLKGHIVIQVKSLCREIILGFDKELMIVAERVVKRPRPVLGDVVRFDLGTTMPHSKRRRVDACLPSMPLRNDDGREVAIHSE